MSGVTDNASDVDFMIANKAQTVKSATSSEIVIQVDEVSCGLTQNKMDLFLGVGIPNGYTELLSGVSFEPKLLSVSMATGSPAGSITTATVKGVGVMDKVTLFDSSSNTDICESTKMTGYGQLECKTKAMEIASPVQLSIKEKDSGLVHACAASNPSDCNYQTTTESNGIAKISQVELVSSTVIRMTGNALPAETCEVSFLGMVADSCVRSDASTVTATFNKGVPTTEGNASPCLKWTKSDGNVNFSSFADTAVMRNPLSITATSSGFSTSFAGGRTLEVTANGLTSDVMAGKAKITVCEKTCEINAAASTDSVFSCFVPAISTVRSDEQFKINSESALKGEEIIFGGMSQEMAERAFDGKILPGIKSAEEECFVGIQMPQGYVGVLSEVSFFLDEFNRDDMIENLTIEGCYDEFDCEPLVEVGLEIHEGWNYYDFYDGFLPRFPQYRLTSYYHGCNSIGEIHFFGNELIDNEDDTYTCNVAHLEGDGRQDLGDIVTYDINNTPVIDDIMPRWGAVSGNTQITFTGRNFVSQDASDYEIVIDDVDCPIDEVSSTEIKCTTAPRLGKWEEDPKLEIRVQGAGIAALQGNNYRYCSLWSEESTWGYLFPPIDGESVAVPDGMCLLVDIQNSPKLKLVQVDNGALIFPSKDDDPTYQVNFDAKYIMVNNGTMEIGTEKHPYLSKLNITMHGEKYDAPMPMFGKKAIGVHHGVLDIHGKNVVSWTELDSTVQPGDTTLTVVEEVNWSVGDEIMVTSTDYNQYHTEFFKITTIKTLNGKTTLSLATAFEHKHYAAVEEHGFDTLTIRAEVCLMTRNVVFRGDPETSSTNKFGAHIMLSSPEDDGVIGRIENLQLNDVGQAFLLGKYPIHFHMVGRTTKSYVRGNAIKHSFNRGTTAHGVKYLRVERNVYWDVMGHTIFVEDGAETKNYFAYNVVAGTKPSFSLLNTDTTPGCFWVTNPDNIFVGNRAAGSTNYGYWMDYQDTAIGASFDPAIKPMQAKLGEFRDNVAHSVGDYGLRIFHGHFPPEEAYYEDHLSYRCGKNGVMGGDYGKIVLRNITVADNANSGIEFERINLSPDLIDVCRAENLVIIGRSNGNPGESTHGIVAPQSDLWLVDDARFYNFQNGAAALGDCAHCDTPKADSGARTTRFSNLIFDDATVDARIKWRWPHKGIFHDLDGTLTGQGADSYVSAYWKHNDWPECEVDLAVYDGIVCPYPYQFERIVFTEADGDIEYEDLYTWQYDNTQVMDMTDEEKEQYLVKENASTVDWIRKARPFKHWTAPYLTHHRYYMRWLWGLDFESV
jgi:hypothetical protein